MVSRTGSPVRTSVRVWWTAVVATIVAAVLVVGIVPAAAGGPDEARLLALTNQSRAASGLPALTLDSQLTTVAQNWAGVLATRGVISHNPSLSSQVTGWKELGENVGVGGTVDAVQAGFVGSPTHYANIVDPSFTRVGLGVVRPDARIFVVVVFMRPSSVEPAPAAPAPAPAPSPAAPAPPPVATPGTGTSAVKPQTAAAPAPAEPAPVSIPTELSLWMTVSLDQVRSMEPAKSR